MESSLVSADTILEAMRRARRPTTLQRTQERLEKIYPTMEKPVLRKAGCIVSTVESVIHAFLQSTERLSDIFGKDLYSSTRRINDDVARIIAHHMVEAGWHPTIERRGDRVAVRIVGAIRNMRYTMPLWKFQCGNVLLWSTKRPKQGVGHVHLGTLALPFSRR